MENREEEINQNLNENEDIPSSSRRRRREEMEPDEEVQVAEKMSKNEDESSNSLDKGQSQGQGQPDQGSEVNEGPISDLPPETMTKILKLVDTRSLFECRLVSRKWWEISTGIVTNRSDAVLHFVFNKGDRNVRTRHRPREGVVSTLMDFVETMETCVKSPYAGFSFYINDPFFFRHQDWTRFLVDFGHQNENQVQNQSQKSNIKYLELRSSVKELNLWIENLRDFLVNQFPNLEEFALEACTGPVEKNIKLFPVPAQLLNLKVLVVRYFMFTEIPGILHDILTAAVNLKTIRVLNGLYNPQGDFAPARLCDAFLFLNSRGKLHLLQHADIQLDQKFISTVKASRDFSSAFKLHHLKLEVGAAFAFRQAEIGPTFYNDAADFVSNLFESSKNSLRKLEMNPLGFGVGISEFLKLPGFPSLKYLKLNGPKSHQTRFPIFPPGVRSTNIFPAVHTLDLQVANFSGAFPQRDSIPRLPSVKTLCLMSKENGITEMCIKAVALMCPNLKNFQIKKENFVPVKYPVYAENIIQSLAWSLGVAVLPTPAVRWLYCGKNTSTDLQKFNFLLVCRSIWSNMNGLESLELDVDAQPTTGNAAEFRELDSCFTGISKEHCERLYDFLDSSSEDRGNEATFLSAIMDADSEMTARTLREFPSILNMKNLKKLVINPYSENQGDDEKEFFAKNMTWISEEYAFKLMPQLEFNGRKASE